MKLKTKTINNWMYCPCCHSFNKVEGKITAELNQDIYLKNVDALFDNIECINCKEFMVPIDNDIFEAINVLNNKGYETLFSCQGHTIGEDAYICFADIPSRYLKQNIEPPKKWFYMYSHLLTENGLTSEQRLSLRPLSGEITSKAYKILNIKWEDLHKEEMNNLIDWARNLPNLDGISKDKLYNTCPLDIHQMAEKLCINEYQLLHDTIFKNIPYRIFEGKILYDDVDYIIKNFYQCYMMDSE